jgi:hypothetical protein
MDLVVLLEEGCDLAAGTEAVVQASVGRVAGERERAGREQVARQIRDARRHDLAVRLDNEVVREVKASGVKIRGDAPTPAESDV